MTPTDDDLRRLRAAFGDGELRITALGGGLHGRTVRVRGDGFDYAVRLPVEGERWFRLDTRTEQQVLAQAAAAGLAPRFVATDPGLGLVVTEFLNAAVPWSAAASRKPHNISRIATQLERLHALDIELAPFACMAAAEIYLDAVGARGSLSPEQAVWAEELLALAAAFDTSFPAAAPCHNDLIAANVLDDGAIRLVDFEFAAWSAPILDLASLAALNAYDAAERARLVAAYYRNRPAPFDAVELETTIRLVRLLAYFWALAYEPAAATPAHIEAFAGAMAAMLR